MLEIKEATKEDKEYWFTLDKHLAVNEFYRILDAKRAYVIWKDGKQVGIWRWNLFWDSVPFITMIYFEEEYRKKGIGRQVMKYWENQMKEQGYKAVMTSTQVDEMAQHFYRKMGYKDCGCLVLDIPELEQPMEMFFIKEI